MSIIVLYAFFSLEKISYQSQSVMRQSVRVCIRFLVIVSPSSRAIGCISNFKLCSCIGHMMKSVLGNIMCDLKVKVK